MYVCLFFVAQGVSEEDLAVLIKFREAVLATEQQGDLITLPKDVEWPQLGSAPLFVRHFYHGCFTGPLQSFTADRKAKYRKFVIIGNPGIGKSAFGCYLLYQAIRAKRTVVYHGFKSDDMVDVFHRDGRVTRTKGLTERDLSVLNDHAVVYISDGITPHRTKAFTVLITSPDRNVWWHFNKSVGCTYMCFPVFSENEILRMWKSCFPKLHDDETGVLDRYSKWGGVPRYVLGQLDEANQILFQSALSQPNYILLAQQLGSEGVEAQAHSGHRLVHLKTRGEYDKSLTGKQTEFYLYHHTELGSNYIARHVYQNIREQHCTSLLLLLNVYPRPAPIATIFGQFFEQEAMKILSRGGTFTIRRLQKDGKGEVCDLKLDPSPLPDYGFLTMNQLKQLSKKADFTTCYPASKSFCAVDFILHDKTCVNATINREHGLKWTSEQKDKNNLKNTNTDAELPNQAIEKTYPKAGLSVVLRALGMLTPSSNSKSSSESNSSSSHSNSKLLVKFYWAVPSTDFNLWNKPQTVTGMKRYEIDAIEIQQFAVCINMNMD